MKYTKLNKEEMALMLPYDAISLCDSKFGLKLWKKYNNFGPLIKTFRFAGAKEATEGVRSLFKPLIEQKLAAIRNEVGENIHVGL